MMRCYSFSFITGENVAYEEAELFFMSPLGFEAQMDLDFVQAVVPAVMAPKEFVEVIDPMETKSNYMDGTPMTSVKKT